MTFTHSQYKKLGKISLVSKEKKRTRRPESLAMAREDDKKIEDKNEERLG